MIQRISAQNFDAWTPATDSLYQGYQILKQAENVVGPVLLALRNLTIASLNRKTNHFSMNFLKTLEFRN